MPERRADGVNRMPIRYTWGKLARLAESMGWYCDRTSGSHMWYKHPEKHGGFTISTKKSQLAHPKFAKRILQQIGEYDDEHPEKKNRPQVLH